MAKELEKFDVGLGVKIQASTAQKLEEIAAERFPGLPNAYSTLVRDIIAKAIADHDATKKRK